MGGGDSPFLLMPKLPLSSHDRRGFLSFPPYAETSSFHDLGPFVVSPLLDSRDSGPEGFRSFPRRSGLDDLRELLGLRGFGPFHALRELLGPEVPPSSELRPAPDDEGGGRDCCQLRSLGNRQCTRCSQS